MNPPEFQPFPKIPRLFRECVITEKIDGTNAQIYVPEDDSEPLVAASRKRWIKPEADNYGFARWVRENQEELRQLGPGTHAGEWWGAGIQRRYGLSEKRFSLFNTSRWNADNTPGCVSVVPVLYQGEFVSTAVIGCLARLGREGSVAAPGFMNPEGVVVYHVAANAMFKATLGNDGHKEAR